MFVVLSKLEENLVQVNHKWSRKVGKWGWYWGAHDRNILEYLGEENIWINASLDERLKNFAKLNKARDFMRKRYLIIKKLYGNT